MDEFELTRRLEQARPALPRRGDPLTPAATSTMQHIMTGRVQPRRPRRSPIYLSVAAALAVLLAVAVGMLTARPAPVYATATPPLLAVTPVEGTSKDLLMRLSEELPDTPAAESIRFQSWALALTIGDEGVVQSVAVEPEVRVVEHRPEGSRIEVRRGEPYDSNGNKIQVDGYQVGELIWEQDFRAGEFPYVFAEPPTDAAAYPEFLQAGSVVPDPTTGDYLNLVRDLLGERALTGAQTRAAVEFLATLPDLQVEGRVTDRLGRTGISYTTDSRAPGEYVERIIISDTGLGILSSETTYVGTDRPDIQAPAVISYTAWETGQNGD